MIKYPNEKQRSCYKIKDYLHSEISAVYLVQLQTVQIAFTES